jgi:hypothetical protein
LRLFAASAILQFHCRRRTNRSSLLGHGSRRCCHHHRAALLDVVVFPVPRLIIGIVDASFSSAAPMRTVIIHHDIFGGPLSMMVLIA